jgi:2-methylaconitate cis-trans-isomerase PrpF
VRGGTSKGIYVERDVLPPEGPERDHVILGLFGSPDKRQIDGLGGADKLTSKVAVMGPPTRPDCDVDYYFGQVMIDLPQIDWKSNCGNLTAGAAVYGVYKGYVSSSAEKVQVAIHQVNTGRRLLATVPLKDGQPATEGDYAIGGVPGAGARVDVNFADFAGCTLNRGLLPTGNPVDTFTVPGLGRIQASVVDMSNLHIFVRAADVGMDHEQDIVSLQADAKAVAKLEAIRAVVAAELDYIKGPDAAQQLKIKMNPLLYVLGRPRSYQTLNNQTVAGDTIDLFGRSITRALFSKAYPASGITGTGVSAGLKGTITAEMCAGGTRPTGQTYTLKVGQPSGSFEVRCRLKATGGEPIVEEATVGRTGRVLMDGVAFVRS